jgi:Spy/CpxP family protein refolding chaperone
MRKWIKRTLIGVFGASVLFGGLAACSHRSHSGWGGAPRSEAEQAEWRAKMVERAASRLELDAAQKAKLALLGDTLAAQRKVMMADGAHPRTELTALIAGERFDRARATSFVETKTAALRQASPAVIAAAADFYDSLNPAQQQKVRDMLARGGHRHGWRG